MKEDSKEWIPFNWPHMTGKELYYIAEANFNGKLAGDGPFTKKCHAWLESKIGAGKALLTHSCTAALEMTALLLDLSLGDEVIMPSYTFVSTANAFVLRGATPVFVDIRADTLNIDENLIEAAITPKTKAIVVVHYAGVACEMDAIVALAKKYNLRIIEDAAQGVMSSYKGRALGTIGDLGTYSFHETKNIVSGEGGALLVNSPDFFSRSEIIREKGTDRGRFFRGEVDKYTWQDYGSSYLPGELISAFLWAQIEDAESITNNRLLSWNRYHEGFLSAEQKGLIRRPVVPDGCLHNAHMYYLLLPNEIERSRMIDALKREGIHAIFHYIPLHSSPAGIRFGRTFGGDLPVTRSISQRVLRLPLWFGLSAKKIDRVIEATHKLMRA
jgi:dTDP-4-amino-4,6-dideoxygalactose transaminase